MSQGRLNEQGKEISTLQKLSGMKIFGWHVCWKHKILWHDSDIECPMCWAGNHLIKIGKLTGGKEAK